MTTAKKVIAELQEENLRLYTENTALQAELASVWKMYHVATITLALLVSEYGVDAGVIEQATAKAVEEAR